MICFNSPFGPKTLISFSEISIFTPSGISIGFFPILDIFFYYQTWQIISPPIFCFFASLFVIKPFDVEIIEIPNPP